MPSVTRPLIPAEPSSVQTISSSQQRAKLVFPEHQVACCGSRGCRSRRRRFPCSRAPAGKPARRPARRRRTGPSSPCRCGSGMPMGPTSASSRLADMAVALDFARGLADGLDDERDRCPRARSKSAMVSGMRSPSLVRHHDDELARPRRLRQQRVTHLQQKGDVRKILPGYDLIPGVPRAWCISIPLCEIRFCPKVSGETMQGNMPMSVTTTARRGERYGGKGAIARQRRLATPDSGP